MKIAIPKSRFLNGMSLVSSDSGFSWEKSLEEDVFILGDANKSKSLSPVFDLLKMPEPSLVSPSVEKAFLSLGVAQKDLPIDGVQSPREMIEKIKGSLDVSRMAIDSLQADGYLDTFMECNRTLRRLQRSRIDVKLLKSAINSGKIKNQSVAKGFYPKRDGYLSIPKYSITKTLTGRMTVIDGPQILTAPKLIREYIRSSYPGGKIAQIDFVSLEPRVAMQLTGSCDNVDIYSHLGKKLFDKKVSRSAVKKLVLCAVYGASESTLKRGLPKGTNIKEMVEKTKELLNYEKVTTEQLDNFRNTGKIKSFFGRSIVPQNNRESLIYNNYIQSSAVDVALLGFGKILDKCSPRVRPIFFIHDALLVDLHPEDIENFKKVSSSIFIDGLGEFPLDFQLLG